MNAIENDESIKEIRTMFAAQTNLITLLCQSLRQPPNRRLSGSGDPGNGTPQGLDDPRRRLVSALAEMLPSTLEEIAQAAGLELATAQAYLAEMSARSRVMFNPLTKRYSLPKIMDDSSFAA